MSKKILCPKCKGKTRYVNELNKGEYQCDLCAFIWKEKLEEEVIEFSVPIEWVKIEYQTGVKNYRLSISVKELKEALKPYLTLMKV